MIASLLRTPNYQGSESTISTRAMSALHPKQTLAVAATPSRCRSITALDTNCNSFQALQHRQVARHSPKDDDARLGNASVAVVDDEVVISSKAQRSC